MYLTTTSLKHPELKASNVPLVSLFERREVPSFSSNLEINEQDHFSGFASTLHIPRAVLATLCQSLEEIARCVFCETTNVLQTSI